MKFPIRRVKGAVPPKFEYSQIVTLPNGGKQLVTYVECVSPSLESALCLFLEIAEQLAAENDQLKRK